MYRDPDEPTSELYRIMPPRRPRSELRQALDAAQGRDDLKEALAAARSGAVGDRANEGDDASTDTGRRRTIPAFVRTAPRRALRWVGIVVTGVLIAVVAGLIVNYLSSHSSSSTPGPAPRSTSSAARPK
jgi:hypothetical protein